MRTFGSKISFTVACFFGLLKANTLTDCNNDIFPSQNDVVICDKSCINCNIRCNAPNKCQEIKVYSGAFNTNIYCFRKETCIYAEIYVGDTGNYPDDYDQSHFNSTQNVTNISCNGFQSCMHMNLIMEGHFNYGGLIKLMHYSQRFIGNLDINIKTKVGYEFNLECDTDEWNCHDVMYTCHNSNCGCTGNCPDIVFLNAPSFVIEYIFT